MKLRFLAAAAAALLISACGSNTTTPTSAAGTPTTATTPTSAATSAAPVAAQVFSPEPGSTQGKSGVGMIVDLAFRAKDPALLPATFRLGGALPDPAAPVKPGHNPAFPGLVVTLTTTAAAAGGPTTNLANLFQLVTTSTQTDGTSQVWATWTNAKPGFGIDTDTELVTYTVRGDAPDQIPPNHTGLDLTSDPKTVTFHLAGPKPA